MMLSIAIAVSLAATQTAPGVTIERITPKHWRATYAVGAPVMSLRFERPASFFREQCWTPATPGYRFARAGDQQVARLDSGASAASDIVFDFAECTQSLPKEYELFQPFTDGAVALYTGHFNATATISGSADSIRIRDLRIVTPQGAHAIVGGHVLSGVVAYSDTVGDGTYVYLGSARPIETRDVVAVVDPGMPVWLRTTFDRVVPRLFAQYTERFGARLPWKPVVLYSFDDTVMSGLSSGGGALTGFINMTLTGDGWRTETPATAEQAFHLIAHESAHLWNGQLVASDTSAAGAWIHEGAADAMANDMLLSLGVIDSARYRERRDEALNQCAASTRTVPVDSAIAHNAIRAVYDCGFVMAVWTGALARQQHAGGSMFTFWRELVRAAQAAGGRYDRQLYFSTLQATGAADSTITSMRRFLAARDSIQIAIRGLRSAGMDVREVTGDPPRAFQQNLARMAMAHLMSQACHGRVSFSSGDPMRTGAVPTCAPFANAMAVSMIQGFRVGDQGAALYDAVRAACLDQGSVALQGADGGALTSVPCTRALAPRLAWYAITGPSSPPHAARR